jgi:hypothetical protein
MAFRTLCYFFDQIFPTRDVSLIMVAVLGVRADGKAHERQ